MTEQESVRLTKMQNIGGTLKWCKHSIKEGSYFFSVRLSTSIIRKRLEFAFIDNSLYLVDRKARKMLVRENLPDFDSLRVEVKNLMKGSGILE